MKTLIIKLGETEYTIQELTVGQVEELSEIVAANSSGKQIVLGKGAAREVVAIGFSEDHPNMTRDVLKKLRIGTPKPLNDAAFAVLRFGGFLAEEGAPTGEAGGQ